MSNNDAVIQNIKDIGWLQGLFVALLLALLIVTMATDYRLDKLEDHTHACVMTTEETTECGTIMEWSNEDE